MDFIGIFFLKMPDSGCFEDTFTENLCNFSYKNLKNPYFVGNLLRNELLSNLQKLGSLHFCRYSGGIALISRARAWSNRAAAGCEGPLERATAGSE